MTDITNGAIGGSLDELAISDLEPAARVQPNSTRGEPETASKKQQDRRKAQAHSNATKEEIEEFQAADENNAASGVVPTPGHKVDRLA